MLCLIQPKTSATICRYTQDFIGITWITPDINRETSPVGSAGWMFRNILGS